MARHPRGVDDAIARFDEVMSRIDGKAHGAGTAARRRHLGRNMRHAGRRAGAMTGMILALVAATIGFGLSVGPIGIGGLFVVVSLALLLVIGIAAWPAEKAVVDYRDDMPNKAVVQRLDSYLVRRRAALPALATRRVDAISAQLPLLEARLEQVDMLDPLAQDARRLMGKHLPELIERYQRVPDAFRHERDGDGLTVDERLVAGLEAADAALQDIGTRLTQGDLDAFATQGRFIESRYKDGGLPPT